MKYIIAFLLTFSSLVFAEEEKRVDCILLEDENSIICKYTLPRVDFEKTVSAKWIDPNNIVSRQREIIIPAYHGSVYDYRYLEGRMKGEWAFEIIDGEDRYTTQFSIE